MINVIAVHPLDYVHPLSLILIFVSRDNLIILYLRVHWHSAGFGGINLRTEISRLASTPLGILLQTFGKSSSHRLWSILFSLCLNYSRGDWLVHHIIRGGSEAGRKRYQKCIQDFRRGVSKRDDKRGLKFQVQDYGSLEDKSYQGEIRFVKY